ncbi:YqhA family protein [Photobacterium makurazakiensis]|uniref:YqhA family protein n=1 Tax=Photobacterium makurazakiensis TaxID=2910234 RepID=UPI003D0C6DC6
MKKKVFNYFRYISWIAILCSMLGSMLLIIIGAYKAYSAFDVFIFNAMPPAELAHLDTADIAISYLIKSLDTFLVALVLFIFAHGIFTLFIWNKSAGEDQTTEVLKWIKTPNIGHLKNILAEVIIVILFVKFLELVLINFNNLSWNVLILPVSILLLSLGLKFLGLGQDENQSE